MACYEKISADAPYVLKNTGSVQPIPPEWWYQSPQDIRKYMTTKDGAIAFAKGDLKGLVATAKNIIANPNLLDWNQAQFISDQLACIVAIDQYLISKYSYPMAQDAEMSAALIEFWGTKPDQPGGLLAQLYSMNPDIGQADYIKQILTHRKAAGETVRAISFVPAFQKDKTAIVVEPGMTPATSAMTPATSDMLAKKPFDIKILALVAIGGFIALKSFK